jgi:polysaccharide export outer membrane protein
MRGVVGRVMIGALLLGSVAARGRAQNPTTAEAQQLLRTRPELVAQLRQRIGASGLTPDQVRARLRAGGYPEDLLDPYLPGSAARPDSIPLANDVFSAVRSLGIADSNDVSLLREIGGVDSAGRPIRSVESDSLARSGRGSESRAAREGELSSVTDTRAGQPALLRDTGDVIFGLNLFRRSTTLFQPNLSGPVDANYRVGPGDQLILILTGDVELAHSLQVTREGFVVVPQVGQLYVANLTLAQIEDLLYARLGRVYSGVRRGPAATTRFSLSVARLRSNQIFVVGDVMTPGSYQVSSAGTALTALYAAGGPTVNGSMRAIEIRRKGKLVDALDVYDYLLRGDASHDVRLENGDVVFVRVRGTLVRVLGQVVRPAIYELKAGETLRDLITAAGGFSPTASRRRLQVVRILPPSERGGGGRDRMVIDIASDAMTGPAGPAFPLEPGDTVRVFAISERVRNRVGITGDVWTPGDQGFTEGMKLSDAIRLAGGVKPDVYLGQLSITRLRPDSTRMQLRSAFRDSTGAVISDVPLREDDEIRVFSVREFRPERYVAISGAVRFGGRYAYREGITVRDLVLLAGGLQESAYLREAEIARLPEKRAGGITATTLRIALDSSYLFERAPDGRYPGPPGLPAGTGVAPEVELRPYDNVLILRQPDWELQRSVVVSGEVTYPGRYALVSKTERLSDLIKRAGGLTAEAYAEGVYFYRRRDKLGRIGIDLPAALRDPRHRDNLILLDGDSLLIPPYNAIVNVAGAVNSPVAVSYVPGEKMSFYIRAAGGPSKRADVKRAYVVQPNGKVESVNNRTLLPDGTPVPRAGGSIYVPEKDPADRRDYVAAVGAVAQILASLVAIVVVLKR